MIFYEACRILSLSGTESKTDIKKRYRQLMHQVHPDALGDRESACGFDAWEINAAYEILMERAAQTPQDKPQKNPSGGTARKWQAPVNEYAFTEREIYVDRICITSGKYYFTEEEGFRMFLYSIYRCSRKVLEPYPDDVVQKNLGEAAYLLSQQFVNRAAVLERYETDIRSDGTIYYFPAMLETEGRRCALQAGTVLAPAGVRNHRLYLNSMSGKEAGYISFHDDLIYYALIPLFEQRMAEIKVRVSGSIAGNNNVRSVRVRTLDLWVRLLPCKWTQIEVNLSDRIRTLLRKCSSESFSHQP